MGLRNCQTVKGVSFFGPRSEFVVAGSDCGHVMLFDSRVGAPTRALLCWRADKRGAVNCLAPAPGGEPVLATSGLEHVAKLWAPMGERTEPAALDGLIARVSMRNAVERASHASWAFQARGGSDEDEDEDNEDDFDDDGEFDDGIFDDDEDDDDDDDDGDGDEAALAARDARLAAGGGSDDESGDEADDDDGEAGFDEDEL